jgi:predicted nucleic acid-binding protein
MGVGAIGPAVADAGPLIHLNEIQSLSLLRLFRPLVLPDAVWQETVEQSRVDENALTSLGNIERKRFEVRDIDAFVEAYHLTHLHRGECEALLACQRDAIQLLLTDDLAVRESAKQLGITPVGSLGVVMRGYRENRISYEQAVEKIQSLYQTSTLFVTPALVDLALEQLAQYYTERKS